MKTIKTVSLILRSGRERSYIIELVDLERDTAKRYLVNYRYGFSGSDLKEGTRTSNPVDLESAERLFQSLIESRRAQGYSTSRDSAPWEAPKATGPSIVPDGTTDPRAARLMYLLERAGSMRDESVSKLIWRIGQVRLLTAAPLLASLRHETGPIASRVLPYALYRCGLGEPNAIRPALEALATDGDEAVSIPARVALSCLSDPASEARRLAEGLPIAVAGALQASPDAAVAQITGYLSLASNAAQMAQLPKGSDHGAEQQRVLVDLFLLSRHAPETRPLVLDILRNTPFAPFLFRGLRRVFKAAEATDDAEIFGLFARKFDEARPGFSARHDYIYVPALGRGMNKDQALGNDDTRVAWSDATRTYFRRRIWRQLRRLGVLDDTAYVPMAAACLLEADDEVEPSRARSQYDWATRRTIETHYPALASRYAVHHIMHGDSDRLEPTASSLIWRYTTPQPTIPTSREEPYSRLWDAEPDTLLQLLTDANAEAVRDFASRALIDNGNFCLDLPAYVIAELLTGDSEAAYAFGLEVSRMQLARRADAFGPLVPALFATGRKEAIELAQTALTLQPVLATGNSRLAAELMLSVSDVTHEWLDAFWTQHAATAQVPDLMAEVAEQAEARDWPEAKLDVDKARMRLTAGLLTKHFRPAIAAVDQQRLVSLSRAPDIPPKLLAILLAASRPDGIDTFDPEALAREEDPDLQAAGAQLLAEADVEQLKGREDLILAFLQSPVAASRVAAVTATERLGASDEAAARTLAQGVVPILYRAETHDGVRDSAIEAARTPPLMAALVKEGPDLAWPLLRAKAEPARRVGSEVLQHLGPNSFSLRKTARIGTNDQVIARRWAVDALETRIEQVQAEPEQIFALLDGKWDDSREAAYTLLRENTDPSDWQPETVVALCDCITPPAQAFGREMLTRAFSDENAPLFLRRLSEHPSNSFRLTIARLIREHAAGDPEKLREVEPALRTILSRVFSSRAAKGQAYAFIREEIERGDPACLPIFGDLLERISATCAVGDRARILSLIVMLKSRDPSLVPLAEVIEPAIREAG